MNIEKTIKNLKLRGFEVSFFENKEAASDYLLSQIKNTTVGIGGCLTADQMGLYEKLIEAGNDIQIGGRKVSGNAFYKAGRPLKRRTPPRCSYRAQTPSPRPARS